MSPKDEEKERALHVMQSDTTHSLNLLSVGARKPFVQWYTVYGIIQIYIENEKRPLELQNQIGIRKKFNLGRKCPFLAHMTALQLISIFGLP